MPLLRGAEPRSTTGSWPPTPPQRLSLPVLLLMKYPLVLARVWDSRRTRSSCAAAAQDDDSNNVRSIAILPETKKPPTSPAILTAVLLVYFYLKLMLVYVDE